ncbi:hypothetical protein J3Q64DRAFT_1870845 [Phycomyces blakesleeanus]|uniref:GST N-terminal domain-containing protein n=2 Tax=Phycomyces blakesleeanus TaxID=4837 RepID=A0A167RCG5_PHYB8|nr:hypothetical protein PHYBLDRAFT_138892 [Phycomyces blakesleeanus NRRL 1555(-)]OAD81344.1 hypothetical protein PHYBLDRAFT_138892 [Phycomyces blakesleeanus NRRL 1555(-)]|eukprot:XP_018299384.1 hypothetical protein PHYBLDRAFT_138892 [Phycomyces blakesleeanus NRRL 1555(-)]
MSPSVILHWYPESLFAQKIAWDLNYKKVDYKTVLINMIEPRPLRRPLDGGYRKTPILQINNHIFCDTKVIIAELEKRYPEPSFYPATRSGQATEALCKAFSQWTDSTLLFALVSQCGSMKLPEGFANDRAAYLGKEIDFAQMAEIAPFLKLEIQAQFEVAEQLLLENDQGSKEWVLGTQLPSMADFHFATDTMFAGGLMGETWLKENFPKLAAHKARVLNIGNYERIKSMPSISAEEALEIAKKEGLEFEGEVKPTGTSLKTDMLVSVTPVDTGKIPVVGSLVHLTSQEVVLKHIDQESSLEVFIHFPVIGFAIVPVPVPADL